MPREALTDEERIAEAEQLAVAAEERAAALRTAIVDKGDDTVDIGELLEAEAEVGRKRGAVDALRSLIGERAAKRAERARADRAAALQQLITTEFGRDELALVERFDALVAEAGELIDLVLAHNAAIGEIRDEVLAVGECGVARIDHGFRIDSHDVEVHPIDPEDLAAEAVARALLARGCSYMGALKVSTATFPEDAIAEAFGIEVGELFGHSDRLRRTAEIVTARDGAAA